MTIFQPSPRHVTRHGDRYLPYAKAAPGTSTGTPSGGGTAGNLAAAAAQGGLGGLSATGTDIQQLASDAGAEVSQLGGGAITQTNQNSDTAQFASGVGFRDIPGYGPVSEAATPFASIPQAAADEEVIEGFADENPYDSGDSVAPTATYQQYQGPSGLGGGNLDYGTGAYGSGSGYDYRTGTFGTNYAGPSTAASRGAAARGLGYASGDPSFGALGSLASAVAGVPFIGGLAGRAADRARSGAGRPVAGDPGTVSPEGYIYGQDGGAYDPITGKRAQGVFGNAATPGQIAGQAWNQVSGGDDNNYFAPTASAAGIRNLPHERAVASQRTPGSSWSPLGSSFGQPSAAESFLSADNNRPSYYNPTTNPGGTLAQPFGPTQYAGGLLPGGVGYNAAFSSAPADPFATPAPSAPVPSVQDLYGTAVEPAGPTVDRAAEQSSYTPGGYGETSSGNIGTYNEHGQLELTDDYGNPAGTVVQSDDWGGTVRNAPAPEPSDDGGGGGGK